MRRASSKSIARWFCASSIVAWAWPTWWKARVGGGVVRLDRGEALEAGSCGLEVLQALPAQVSAGAELELIGVRIPRYPDGPDGSVQPGLQRVGDGIGDLGLDREGVDHLAVVGLGPEMEAVPDADQLGGHPQVLALPPHAAFHHVGHAQPPADLAQVFILVLEIERRRAPGDLQVGDLGKAVDDLLGQAVGEILGLFEGAVVLERQHGHRLVRRPGAQHRGAFAGGAGREARHLRGRKTQHRQCRAQQQHVDPADPGPCARFGRPGALNAVRPALERPGDHQGDRKAQNQQHQNEGRRPFRQVERLKHRIGDLKQAPGGDGVQPGDADHVPPLQLA
jgi:hypothetical protein